MKTTNIVKETEYNLDELEADSSFIKPGTYMARLQYFVMCTKNDNNYAQFIFETNKQRISNGKNYKLKVLMNGDKFQSIFFYEDYKNYIEPLNKVFKVTVEKEGQYTSITQATEYLEFDPEIMILPTQDDWSYAELSRFKNATYIYFPDKTRKNFQEFIDEVEQYEIELAKSSKNKDMI